jgi:hypothetical protein
VAIRHMWLSIVTVGLAAAISMPVFAEETAIKAPRTAAVATAGGFYIWADGSYQSIHLPTFDLGVQRDTITTLPAGPFESYSPRATGYGVSGAVGYFLPHGTLPSAFGSNGRVEVGASYVNATASQSGTGAAAGTPGLLWQLLNGLMFADTGCGAGTCTTSSVLSTKYTAWNVNAKVAGDHAFGNVTVTPSVLVFGGKARTDQTFSQSVDNAGFDLGAYNSNSSLHWTDWGARFGLDSKWAMTDTVTFGLSGNIGIARRAVSLAADDTCGCAGFVGGISAVSASTVTTPFLANAEASFAVKLTPAALIKSFVGLNYDSRVPGISAQSHSGTVAVATFGTPAGIKFAGETSWYAGGGLTVNFTP